MNRKFTKLEIITLFVKLKRTVQVLAVNENWRWDGAQIITRFLCYKNMDNTKQKYPRMGTGKQQELELFQTTISNRITNKMNVILHNRKSK